MLLSKRPKKSLLEWTPVPSRIITARFKSRGRPISIIQCYAPTETLADETKEKLYGLLNTTIAKIKKKGYHYLNGRFKCKDRER
jgi:hypothetical protein